MITNESSARITSVKFRNYKALRDFQIRLKETNILVGPNNAGKSTIVGGFRALAVALRRIKGKKPDVVSGPNGRRYGVVIPPDALPISIENVHTDYSDEDSSVSFLLSNGNELQLYFPREEVCVLVAETHNIPLLSAAAFRKAFPIQIAVVPVLGPVEHKEEVVQAETVQRNLVTHRASRNFRSYWYHFPDSFDEFAALVSGTWTGIEIEAPTIADHRTGVLSMFCSENRILREIYWVGSGFQIWCQLLTHLIRAKESSLIVIDEPEVYLHADLQRQLVGLVREFDADILLATHSTEIMGESEPTDLVLIDKKNKAGERIKNVEKLQGALSAVGSVLNITLSRLARSRRIVFIEGDRDYKLIRMIARRLGFLGLASGLEIVPALSEGFGSWEKLASLGWGIEKALGEKLAICAIYDRDYFCDDHISSVVAELSKSLSFAHVHTRKEIENYLLIPSALSRALNSALRDRSLRDSDSQPIPEDVEGELLTITERYKSEVQSQKIGKEMDYRREIEKRLDSSTLYSKAAFVFESTWATLEGRLTLVSGKSVLADLRTIVMERHGVSLNDSKIISSLNPGDVPPDFLDLLNKLESFRTTTP